MQTETILIVDTSMSANPYYDLFRTFGKKINKPYNMINVISDEDNFNIYKSYVEYPGIADRSIRMSEIDSLKDENVTYILNGSDSGYLAYCKLIASRFPEISNQFDDVKINKYELYAFLRSKKLINTNQHIINSKTYKKTTVTKPSVLKPIAGAGGKDTFYINSTGDLSVLENLSGEFILQDMLVGEEYSVDFVSSNGVHKLCAVWKYTKLPHHHHREEIDLLNPNENEQLVKNIYKYLTTIFDAIKHKNGPTHSEVIVSGTDINLIEINFRLHGHLGNGSQEMCIGTSQAKEVILNYKKPTWTANLDWYNYMQPLKKILLNNKREKFIESVDWELIEKNKSVLVTYRHNTLCPGVVPVSTSVQTTLGFIMMTNKNLDNFNKDVELVRQLKNDICS